MATAIAVGVAACSGGSSVNQSAAPAPAAAATGVAHGQQDWHPTIRTASLPADPCAWIPASDAEAVFGKLAEPPKRQDGCRYTFVLPDAVSASRQKFKSAQEKLRESMGATGGEEIPEFRDAQGIPQSDPRSYAVSVSVDVNATAEAELAASAMSNRFGLLAGTEMDRSPADAASTEAEGWDDTRSIPYGFVGRVGHVRVTVNGHAPDVPRAPMQVLAARVRDRIPDLPFAVTNPYQVIQIGAAGDPCSLLTRAEVEGVLGPLAIEPYRSSSYSPPLAHRTGQACAYFTPGHHVFVVSPTWQGGADSFKIEKGIGGFVGMVAPQDAVVIKGPWDQAHVSNTSGALLFVKGDRLLEVHYRTSRATQGDAVKLAALAMARFAP